MHESRASNETKTESESPEENFKCVGSLIFMAFNTTYVDEKWEKLFLNGLPSKEIKFLMRNRFEKPNLA